MIIIGSSIPIYTQICFHAMTCHDMSRYVTHKYLYIVDESEPTQTIPTQVRWSSLFLFILFVLVRDYTHSNTVCICVIKAGWCNGIKNIKKHDIQCQHFCNYTFTSHLLIKSCLVDNWQFKKAKKVEIATYVIPLIQYFPTFFILRSLCKLKTAGILIFWSKTFYLKHLHLG